MALRQFDLAALLDALDGVTVPHQVLVDGDPDAYEQISALPGVTIRESKWGGTLDAVADVTLKDRPLTLTAHWPDCRTAEGAELGHEFIKSRRERFERYTVERQDYPHADHGIDQIARCRFCGSSLTFAAVSKGEIVDELQRAVGE